MRWIRAAMAPVLIATALTGAGLVVGALVTLPASPAGAAVSAAGGYVAVAPSRILDTRNGTGVVQGEVHGYGMVSLPVAGVGTIPGDAVAVALNVTVTSPTAPGYLTVWDALAPRPGTSNLNFLKNQTVPNAVVTPIGSNGSVDFFNGSGGTVQIVADVFGYYVTGTAVDPGTFASITPKRALDTRIGTGAPKAAVRPGGTVSLTVTTTDFPHLAAVVLNVTATAPTANGYLTVWNDGATQRPATSSLNFLKNQTVPNLVITQVGADGKIDFYNGSAGTVQIVADVSGYYLATPSTPITDEGALQPLTPARVLDTRSGIGATKAAVSGRSGVAVQITGRGGVPASGVAAVILNVTVTSTTGAGYITAYADGAVRPKTSNLNYLKGQTVPNLVIAPVGADGRVVLAAQASGATQLVADVFGYILGTPQPSWSPKSAPLPGDASAGPSSALAGVSCPGPGSCVAVGSYSSTTDGAVMEILDSGVWTASESPLPSDPSAHAVGRAELGSISCTSVGTCVAVGSVPDSAGPDEGNGLIESLAGGTQTPTVAPIPGSPANPQAALDAVDCPAAGTCVAVGEYEDTSQATQGLIEVLSGGTWSALEAPLPAGASGSDPEVELTSLTCSDVSTCVAIGSYVDSSDHLQAVVETLSGGSWTAQQPPLPSNASTTDAEPELNALSCPASGTCELVGDYFDTVGTDRVLIDGLTGTTLSAVQGASLGGAASDVDATLFGVSCPAAGSCIAVGLSTVGSGTAGVVETLATATWTQTLAPLPTNANSSVSFLNTLTCPALGSCTAVGGYIDGANHVQGLIETLASGTWTPVTAPLPSNDAAAVPNVDLGAVACSSDNTTCVAGGFYPTSSTIISGLLETYLS